MLRISRLAATFQAVVRNQARTMRVLPMRTNFQPVRGYAAFGSLKASQDIEGDVLASAMEDNNLGWKADYKQVIKRFPFQHIPIALVRNPDKFDFDAETKKQLIAFKTLSLKGTDLEFATQLLLSPEQRKALLDEPQKHRNTRVFQYYFENKIPELIAMLNGGSGDFEDRLIAIMIIAQMNGVYMDEKGFRGLDERKIVKQDPSGVLTAYYTRYAIKNEMDYLHLLPLLIDKLSSAQQEPESKLMIARSILSADNFEHYYPKKVLDLALETYTTQLPQLHNYEILYLMRLCYNYNSDAARSFGEALISHIKTKHVVEGNIDFHVPMILKAIKYCSKRRLSCDQLTDFITNNMVRFKNIFEKKNISKGLLFSLMFSRTNNRDVSEELLGYLKEYFLNTIEQISKADEVDEGELLRASKLLIRYFDRLSTAEKAQIRQKYISYIIPHFNEQNQVLLYSLLVVLRQKLVKPEDSASLAKFKRDLQYINKMIIQYLESCSERSNGKQVIARNINSATELMYQVTRHQLDIPHSRLPSLLAYDFSQKDTISPEVLGYFFSYLTHCQEKEEDIRRAIDQFEPILESYLRKKKVYSLNTLYSILNVCSNVSYDHNFLFKHIENCFSSILINNPNMFIPEKDIKFINTKLIKRGYGSHNLKKFIGGVLDNSKNWTKLRFDYVEKQKQFSNRMARERKERER